MQVLKSRHRMRLCSPILKTQQGAGTADKPHRADGGEFGAGFLCQNSPTQIGTAASKDHCHAQQGPAVWQLFSGYEFKPHEEQGLQQEMKLLNIPSIWTILLHSYLGNC